MASQNLGGFALAGLALEPCFEDVDDVGAVGRFEDALLLVEAEVEQLGQLVGGVRGSGELSMKQLALFGFEMAAGGEQIEERFERG